MRFLYKFKNNLNFNWGYFNFNDKILKLISNFAGVKLKINKIV